MAPLLLDPRALHSLCALSSDSELSGDPLSSTVKSCVICMCSCEGITHIEVFRQAIMYM
jgi:hypothetical protein